MKLKQHFLYPLLLLGAGLFGCVLGDMIPPRFVGTVGCFWLVSLLLCFFTWRGRTMNVGIAMAFPLLSGIFLCHLMQIFGQDLESAMRPAILIGGVWLILMILAFTLPIRRVPRAIETLVAAALAVTVSVIVGRAVGDIELFVGVIAAFLTVSPPAILLAGGNDRFGPVETSEQCRERMQQEQTARESSGASPRIIEK